MFVPLHQLFSELLHLSTTQFHVLSSSLFPLSQEETKQSKKQKTHKTSEMKITVEKIS